MSLMSDLVSVIDPTQDGAPLRKLLTGDRVDWERLVEPSLRGRSVCDCLNILLLKCLDEADVDAVESNLSYSAHELQRALEAVKDYIDAIHNTIEPVV